MRILWIKIPKPLEQVVLLLILWLLLWFYNNIAWITIFVLSILFLYLFYTGIINIINKYHYLDVKYRRNIWTLFIILSLVPWYLGGYMLVNYDESNKYLQEKSIGGIIEIWKFAFTWKKINMKNILNVVETNIKDDLKDKAMKDTLDSLSWWTLSE